MHHEFNYQSCHIPENLPGIQGGRDRVSVLYLSCMQEVVVDVSVSHSRTIRSAVKYLHTAQQPCGGWIGAWGICLTYATMFALESLSLVGENYSNSNIARRACEFLLEKQRVDGGWGESYKVRGLFSFVCASKYDA
jgi:squalene cyclase